MSVADGVQYDLDIVNLTFNCSNAHLVVRLYGMLLNYYDALLK